MFTSSPNTGLSLAGLSRRTFVKTLSAGVASLSTSSWATPSAHALKRIGFVGGIVNKELKENWKDTLIKAVDYGFSEIETGSYFGNSGSEFLRFCRQINLKPIGGGIPFSADVDTLLPKLDGLNTLNAKYAIVYKPWLVSGPYTLADCQRSADLLNKLGDICKQRKLTLCWHNHSQEFTPMESGLPFDYLMAHTDPTLVKCEMDLYWVAKGGADPLAMLQKYTGQYAILHVKDMASGPAKDFACPGSGILDFQSLLAEAQRQTIQHYMVERDNIIDGLACLKSSGRYLSELQF